MSLHFEWTLSLRLRPDTPDVFLDELRYHLGLTYQAPQAPTLDYPGAALVTGGDESLPGGPMVKLIRQQHGNGPAGSASWGLFARAFVLDDAMYELVQVLPPWLARWSLTEGWIGFAREELDLDTWLNFYAAHGHAYAASPGEEPHPCRTEHPRSPPARPPNPCRREPPPRSRPCGGPLQRQRLR